MAKNKVPLKYTGKFISKGIYFVPEDKVDDLLKSGDYTMPGEKLKSTNKTKFITEGNGKRNKSKK